MMKPALIAIAILFAFASAAQAETCHEKFVRLMVDGNGDRPVKIHVVQETKGAKPSVNEFFQQKVGHWMTKMIDPANQPWVLTYKNTMYSSADEGKSWAKIRAVDSALNAENGLKARQENANTVSNAACGEEDLDGVAHDTVEADFNSLQSFKTENHYKYWVNRETGWISKVTYLSKAEGYEGFTTQTLEPVPDLSLPTPE